MPTSEVIFRLCVGISVRMLQNSRGMTNSMFVLAGLPVQFSKSDRMLLFLRSEEKYIITKIGSQQFFSLFSFFQNAQTHRNKYFSFSFAFWLFFIHLFHSSL